MDLRKENDYCFRLENLQPSNDVFERPMLYNDGHCFEISTSLPCHVYKLREKIVWEGQGKRDEENGKKRIILMMDEKC